MAEELTKITQTYSYQVYPPNKHIDPAAIFSRPNVKQEDLFEYKMLASVGGMRQRVIKIKDGLRQALIAGKSFPRLCLIFWMVIATAWRIRNLVGKVTRENTAYKNDHVLIDCLEIVRGCHHNAGREVMVNSAGEVFLACIAHDNYYKQIFHRMIYYIHKKIEAGEWVLDLAPFPKDMAHCWDDKKFQESISSGGF